MIRDIPQRFAFLSPRWSGRFSAFLLVLISSVGLSALLSGCGGSSATKSAQVTCMRGEEGPDSGVDAYVAKRVCGSVVPAYAKPGGHLAVLDAAFYVMEEQGSIASRGDGTSDQQTAGKVA